MGTKMTKRQSQIMLDALDITGLISSDVEKIRDSMQVVRLKDQEAQTEKVARELTAALSHLTKANEILDEYISSCPEEWERISRALSIVEWRTGAHEDAELQTIKHVVNTKAVALKQREKSTKK